MQDDERRDLSDAERLKSKLERLGSPAARRALVARLGSGGSEARIAFCEFLDEIILARRVGFRPASGDALVADIANRRLLRIETLPAHVDAPASAMEALRPGDAAQIRQVADAIGAFLDGAGAPLSVTEDPLPERPSADMLGRSAAALADAMGVTLYAAPAEDPSEPPPPPREAGSPTLEDIALAVRQTAADGRTALLSGDAGTIDASGRLAGVSLGNAMAGLLAAAPLVAVYGRPDADRAVLVRVDDATRLEAIVPAGRIGPAITAALDLGAD